ncbi:craniofacial development protein 2-like protein [Plakobranchus ocellatus]|uniref:Craniofacial development protein 2-like protein n=1 Tax=Plakobranchus ocellatus TaxID=259542 RepID=A0AAV4ADJ5_9GAST|nr:craniofacial development protein 2-like protein [Plakobranchus ocellatus]
MVEDYRCGKARLMTMPEDSEDPARALAFTSEGGTKSWCGRAADIDTQRKSFLDECDDWKFFSPSTRMKQTSESHPRESYVPQVTPDRHQATARKLKDKLNIATWNIRTPLQKGKLENIKQEMERMKLNILGLSEVRWKGAGKITSGGHEIIYSDGTESEKGVGIIVEQTLTKAIKGYWALSDRVLLVKIVGKPVNLNIIQVYAPTANSNDEDLDKFYNDLDTAKTQCKSQDPLIIMGDFNAKVGTDKVDAIVGKHGLGIRNERGRQREKIMDGLATWLGTGKVLDTLAADLDMWRNMIANAYKQGT